MKLNADLPKWIAYPLRLILYSFVMFVLFNIAVAVVSYRVANNTIACSGQASANYGGALSQAKAMVSCMRNKNGIFEDLLMRSTYSAIDAMPITPKQFVGVWDASQPQCNYRHTLKENGEFISEPMECNFSSTSYRGAWGVHDGKMIWLPDEGEVWPPDINQIDSVDSDFFLLAEKDGSRTKFSRVNEVAEVAVEEIVPEVVRNNAAGNTGIESPSEEQEMVALQEVEIESSEIAFTPKYEASDPNAPIEAAVLTGGVILPVLSIPSNRRQLSALNSRRYSPTPHELTMDNLTRSCIPSEYVCDPSVRVLAKHYYMSSIPDRWFDAEGNVYESRGVKFNFSERRSSIGFNFQSEDQKSGKSVDTDRVLLSRKEGFGFVRTLPASEWQEWPEFRQELQSWAKQYFSKCSSVPDCEKSISWLSSSKNFHGEAREFELQDGRKLQFLQAESQTEGDGVLIHKPAYVGEYAPPDTLTTNLWRLVNTDGSVHILRINDGGWLDVLGNTVLNVPYCESQCDPSWTGNPEVISADGGTFVFGPYAGGTVNGYLFLEVLPTELKFLGWYRWGS